MGAAEYLQRYKAQQAGQEAPAPTISESITPEPTSGAAAYLERYNAKQSGQPAEEPTPAPEAAAPAPEEDFNVGVISEGMKKGFADVAALPGYLVDATNWLMDQIPGLDMDADPIGGSKMIREGWEKLLLYKPQTPKTETEKYIGKASEFLGGSIIMGGAMINKMLGAKATMAEIKRATIYEAVESTVAGLTSQWQGDIFADAYGEEYRFLGELSGATLGTLTTATGAEVVNLLRKHGLTPEPLMRALKVRGVDDIRALANDYGGAYARNRARRQIAEAIGENPNSSRNIDRTLELGDEIEDFRPSAAQAADSPGMAAMQQSVDSKNVANINRAIKNEMANTDAVEAYYRAAFPEPSVRDFEAKKIFKSTTNDIKMEFRQIERQQKELAKAYGRKPTEAIGRRLITIAQEKMKVVRKAKNAKYDELYQAADQMGVVDDISDIRKLVVDIQADDQYFFDTVPGVYKKIKSLLSEGAESASGLVELPPGLTSKPTANIASFRKMHSLYREISREYGRALKNDDGVKLFHLGGIKNTLDDKLAKFDDLVYGDFAKHKAAVDTFYRDEYYNVFKQGLGAQVLGIGKNKQTAEGLIISSNVLKKGTSQGLDQFNKLYEDIPEAQLLLRDGIMDTFSQKTIKQGKLSQSAVDNFMSDYKEVLDKVPTTKAVFAHTETMLDNMATRQQKIQARLKGFIRKTATNEFKASPYAKLAGFETLDQSVNYALTDKDAMRILLRSMKTTEAKEGLASTFADHIMNQKNPWGFLKDNDEILRPIFNQLKPGHYNNLKNVAEAMDILNRHSTVMRLNPNKATTDQLQEMIGTSVPSAFAQLRWAALYGKTSMSYVGMDIGSKYLFKLHQSNVERLIEDALYEPDLAKLVSDITKLEKVGLPPKMASRLGQWAMERGIRATPRAAKAAAIAYDQEQQANTP
jgi:hypothetical protein